MERYVATQFYKADSPESRILRESGIAPSEFVLAADAQATIAALQAQLATCFKLSGADPDGNEDWRLAPHAVEEVTRLRNDCDELGDETGALREQLAQRTAECDALKLVNDTHMKTVMTLSHIVEQQTAELEAVSNFIGVQYDAESRTWVSGQAPYQSAGTTKQEACIAAVDALRLACATWETKYRDLQAELERVRADNKALDEWRADVTVSLQRPGGAFFVDVPQHIKDLVAELERVRDQYADLRKMVLALPKVEAVPMTDAGWTRERPTAAGWYWNRINGTVGIALITRRDGRLYVWLKFKDAWLTREGWLDYIHGEWLGPITPDSYARGRVEGLT